jgi:Histidine kinase
VDRGDVTTIDGPHAFAEMLRRGGRLAGRLSPVTIALCTRDHTGNLRHDNFYPTCGGIHNWLEWPHVHSGSARAALDPDGSGAAVGGDGRSYRRGAAPRLELAATRAVPAEALAAARDLTPPASLAARSRCSSCSIAAVVECTPTLGVAYCHADNHQYAIDLMFPVRDLVRRPDAARESLTRPFRASPVLVALPLHRDVDQLKAAGHIRPKEAGARLIRVRSVDRVESADVRPKTVLSNRHSVARAPEAQTGSTWAHAARLPPNAMVSGANVGGALALAWVAYRLRLGQSRAAVQLPVDARLSERTRIARELHDTLLKSVHGLLLRLQTALYLLRDRPAQAKEHLAGAMDPAAKTVTEGRDLRDIPQAAGGHGVRHLRRRQTYGRRVVTGSAANRILTVDDDPVVREGRIRLNAHEGPDVTLMDIQMPEMNVLDALIGVPTECPDARVITLTRYECDVHILRTLETGAPVPAQEDVTQSLSCPWA